MNEDEDETEGDPSDEKLLISQDGNDYVASSKVDDYKYRPEVYVSASLYDWTRLHVKVRNSRKVNDKTCFHFLPGHGQRNTHVVKLVSSRSEMFLLNFNYKNFISSLFLFFLSKKLQLFFCNKC